MKRFNLEKFAASKDYTITDKMIQQNRENMNLCNKSQGVVDQNINLSMPVKNKDNTVLFEKQLEANRKDKKESAVTEKSLNTSEKIYNEKRLDEWDTNIMPINLATEAYDQEKIKAIKKAEDKDKKETAFWDKYVGVQMEGPKTKVDKNVPKSQLENSPDRFKNLGKGEAVEKSIVNKPIEEAIDAKYDKMVAASLQDADAMLFHIYAGAAKEERNLTKKEKQIVSNINNGKLKILGKKAQMLLDNPQLAKEDAERDIMLDETASLDLKVNSDNSVSVIHNSAVIDLFNKYPDVDSNIRDATASYYPDLENYRK